MQLFDSRNISLGAQKVLQDWPLVTWCVRVWVCGCVCSVCAGVCAGRGQMCGWWRGWVA